LLARGFAAADHALAVDSSAADAWMARGYLLAQRDPRTLAGVREAFERAIALEPENAEAWHQYGWFLELERDPARAVESFRRALAIDPERAVTWYHLAWVSMTTGRTGDAEDQLDSALAFDPSSDVAYAMRAIVHLRKGDVARSRDDAQAAVRVAGQDRFWGEAPLAMVEARVGDSVAARARANALAATLLATDQPVGIEAGWLVGSALVAVGERARAIEFIEQVRPRGAHLWLDFGIAELDPIRSEPQFQAILAESRWPGSQ
jgi:Tfp pilus assembly protein PilF